MPRRIHFYGFENMLQRVVKTAVIGNCKSVIMIAGRVVGVQFQRTFCQFNTLFIVTPDII